MNLAFFKETSKVTIFKKIENFLSKSGFTNLDKDDKRPWGGFFVIDEEQTDFFIKTFFAESILQDLLTGKKISPKILIVEAGKRLSWQYHFRRAELWKVISKEVGIVTSETDQEKEMKKFCNGSIIKLQQGERHRLIGLNDWGIVAEIWQHTDIENPSDEGDIIRLQDDYGR